MIKIGFKFPFAQILKSSLFLGVLAFFFANCSAPKEDENLIRMGFTPAESTEKVNASGKVLADILEKQTGFKYKTFVASDYTALIEAMRSGQVDIAWLAPFAFVLAENTAGAKVLLKSIRHGKANQYSAIVVRDSSKFKTLQDLKGATIAWTDPSSSSGHITPKSSIIAEGVDPENFFSKQTFAGSHETLVLAVSNGSVDAGATFSDNAEGSSGSWTLFMKNAGPKAEKLRAVYVTPPMPSDTVSVSKMFSEKYPDRVLKIKEAIKGLAAIPEGKDALKNLYNIEGLVDAGSEEYEPLRKAAAKLGYELDKK